MGQSINTTAPHEGIELQLVIDGKKPIGLVEQLKDPVQYRQVLHNQNIKIKVRTSEEGAEVLFALPNNSALMDMYELLQSPQAARVVRSKAEHQRLMGRLFGYSEEEIEGFINGDIKCNCSKCKGVSSGS
jgi:hypothetical protein